MALAPDTVGEIQRVGGQVVLVCDSAVRVELLAAEDPEGGELASPALFYYGQGRLARDNGVGGSLGQGLYVC